MDNIANSSTATEAEIINRSQFLWETKNIIFKHNGGAKYSNSIFSRRYDTYIFKGAGSKNQLKRYMATEKNYIIATQILDYKGFRQFIAFKSWADAFDKYKHTAYDKRYIYEMILSDKPCKPYLDIEWNKTDDEDYNLDNFIIQLKKDLIHIFSTRYNKQINDEHIFIIEAHKSTKYSFHVTITSKPILFVFDTNTKRTNNSAWDLHVALTELNPDYINKIDEAVYSTDREMRCIYSTKFNEDRMFYPYKGVKKPMVNNFTDYIITDISNDIESIQTTYDNSSQIFHPKKSKNVNIKNKETDDFIIQRILELLRNLIHPTAVYTGITHDNGYRFTYNDRTETCYTGYQHKNNGFCVYIKNNTNLLYMFCYSAKCNKLFLLGHLYENVTWNIGAHKFDAQYIEYNDGFTIKTNEITHSIMPFSKNKGGIVCIKSPMGTGKTQCLKQFISNLFEDKRIMYFSHRQCFSRNIEGNFKELEFYNYMDGAVDLYKKQKIIIQIDSILKLQNKQYEYIPYDLIIIDEIESILFHLSSITLKNRMYVCDVIKMFMKNATHIIALDADFGQRSYDFLTMIKQKPTVFINSFKPITPRRFFLSNDQNKYIFQITEDLKNKKKIVIVTLSKKKADQLENDLQPYGKIINHTSMQDDQTKAQLVDVNSLWSKYDVVIYTPTIDAGVDFNLKYFHKMYCFICSGSVPPRVFLQMTGRVRHLFDNNIHVTYDYTIRYDNFNTYIPTLVETENFIINQNKDLVNREIKNKSNGNFQITSIKNEFTKLFAYNYLESYKSNVMFMQILKELIIEKNYEYILDDVKLYVANNANLIDKQDEKKNDNDDENDDENDDKSDTNDTENSSEHVSSDLIINPDSKSTTKSSNNTNYDVDLLIKAIDVSNITSYETKRNTNNANMYDKYVIKRYYLKKLLKIELTAEVIKIWHNKEKQLNNLLCAIGKKSYDDSEDPYFMNMGNKIKYLNKILDTFGFKDPLDFETIITSDNDLLKKFEDSKIMNKNNYINMMKTFNKRVRNSKYEFLLNTFIVICNSVLHEFCLLIRGSRIRKKANKGDVYCYTLNSNVKYLNDILNAYK